MFTPGAARSTERRPTLENQARLSALSVAATETTFGVSYDDGYVGAASLSLLSLPAAATKSAPSASVVAIASASACEYSSPAQELFRICAPLRVAYRIAPIASAVVPDPFAPRNFSAIVRTVQLTPEIPIPLSPIAPIVPATCVPCPWSSAGLLSPFAKSQPRQSST